MHVQLSYVAACYGIIPKHTYIYFYHVWPSVHTNTTIVYPTYALYPIIVLLSTIDYDNIHHLAS